MKKVVILDGQTIQALPAAKSLKQKGYYVVLLCDSKNTYGFRTKYADKCVLSPSTKDDTEGFHCFLLDYLKLNQVDALIPMNDYSALYLSQYKDILSQYSKFIIPSFDIFQTAYDKNELMKICLENNFPHPKTVDLTLPETENSMKNIEFPALIKPNKTTGARGFVLVQSKQEIVEKLPAIEKIYGACHLQEYIPSGGKQYKVELFVYNDRLINSTVLHKIRFYPEKGGSSCFNQTVEKWDLVEICYQVLLAIGWEGFADFDLIEDPRDGVVKIMEINPRVPACIKASINSGVDFVENIVNASLGMQLNTFVYKPGIYLRYFGLDLLWFISSKQRFKIKPSWFKALLSKNQYFQDGGWDDPKPFIFGTIGGFFKQLNPRFRAEKKGMN